MAVIALGLHQGGTTSMNGNIMPAKLFLYSEDSVTKDTKAYFQKKGYTLTALSSDAKTFWDGVASVSQDGYLVIQSHGDENGFLMVGGQSGSDMTADEIETFGSSLTKRNITLYLLSCKTGNAPFFTSLENTKCKFAAPLGYAMVRSFAGGAAVFSVKDDKAAQPVYLGWAGTPGLLPNRSSTPLNIK